MCCEMKCLLNSLIGTISGTDWWMFGITAISIICSVILSILLYRLTKKLGEQQNTIQQNNIRIQMHKEYYEIYEAFVNDIRQINGLKHKFINVLEERGRSNINDCKVVTILARAKQLLPPNDFKNLADFASDYTTIKRSTPNLFDYIVRSENETRIILKDKLITEDIISFLKRLYEIIDYYDIDMYRKSIERITTLESTNFIEKIRLYSDLSDILQNK